MTKKRMKPSYKPPQFRDLSAYSVSGQYNPQAICQDGSNPISYTCSDGPNPTQPESCSPTGLLPTYGRCSQGGNAVEGCYTGSGVNDCVSGTGFI